MTFPAIMRLFMRNFTMLYKLLEPCRGKGTHRLPGRWGGLAFHSSLRVPSG